MTAAPPSSALRLVRLLRPGSNPLARGVDRVEAAVVKLAVLLALVLVPVMLTIGSLTSDGLAQDAARQAAARHEAVAVLTKDAPATSLSGRGEDADGKSKAPAQWRAPDGTTHTGLVEADDGLKTGAKVSVWLDRSGRPADPPLSAVDIVAASALVVVFGWLAAVGALAALCVGLHHMFDRRRYRTWDIEWTRGEPDWHERSR